MDPAIANATAEVVTGLGLPGLVIFALFKALIHVFNLYVLSIEKRVEEGNRNREAVERNTSAFTALSELIKGQRS